MQRRLSGQRRHGDVQSRVPIALLQLAIASDLRVHNGMDSSVVATGGPCSAAREFRDVGLQAAVRHRAGAKDAEVRAKNVSRAVSTEEWTRAARSSVARHIQQLLS